MTAAEIWRMVITLLLAGFFLGGVTGFAVSELRYRLRGGCTCGMCNYDHQQ